MKILVTGSAGFIGSALVERLKSDGHRVTGFDLKRGEDIRNAPQVLAAVFDKDVVFHQAAANLIHSKNNPKTDLQTNALGALNVLEACRQHNARLIMASTGSVYPQPNGIPGTPYGISKLAAEHYARLYRDYEKVNVSMIRYFSVYGPGMPTEKRGVIGIWLRRALEGKDLVVEGGDQTRSFCFIDDIVGANLAVMEKGTDFMYEAGMDRADQEMTMRELAVNLARAFSVDVRYVNARPGDDIRRVANTKPLRALGWEPKVLLHDGTEKTREWLISQSL